MTLEIAHGPVRRGRRTVLQANRIVAESPAAIAIVGINGSGKSSFFMQLTDTLASRGTASMTVDGCTATLACVPQAPALPAWLRAERVATLYGVDYAKLIERMPGLHLDELTGARVSRLSAGQRQGLAIALALARNADVTILDEPFTALDFRRRLATIDLLRAARAAGRSVLLSSQSAADLVAVCDRYVVLRDGRSVFDGTTTDIAPDADATALEQGLLRLLTVPVPAMEVPGSDS